MARNSRSSATAKLARIEAGFRMCRSIGHAWKYTKVWETPQGPIQGLRCTRCDTEKRQQLSTTGYLVSTSYQYPEGYLVDGLGFLDQGDRATLRLMSLQDVEVVEENRNTEPTKRRKK